MPMTRTYAAPRRRPAWRRLRVRPARLRASLGRWERCSSRSSSSLRRSARRSRRVPDQRLVHHLLARRPEIVLIALPMTLVIVAGRDRPVGRLACSASSSALMAYAVEPRPAARADHADRASSSARLCGALNGFLVTRSGCRRWRSRSARSRCSAAWRSSSSATRRSPTSRAAGPTARSATSPGTAIPNTIVLFAVLAVALRACCCTSRRSAARSTRSAPTRRRRASPACASSAIKFVAVRRCPARSRRWPAIVYTLRSRRARGDNAAGLELQVDRRRAARRRVDLRRPRHARSASSSPVLLLGGIRNALLLSDVHLVVLIHIVTARCSSLSVLGPNLVRRVSRRAAPASDSIHPRRVRRESTRLARRSPRCSHARRGRGALAVAACGSTKDDSSSTARRRESSSTGGAGRCRTPRSRRASRSSSCPSSSTTRTSRVRARRRQEGGQGARRHATAIGPDRRRRVVAGAVHQHRRPAEAGRDRHRRQRPERGRAALKKAARRRHQGRHVSTPTPRPTPRTSSSTRRHRGRRPEPGRVDRQADRRQGRDRDPVGDRRTRRTRTPGSRS